MIESSFKKHKFITDTAKTCKYLLHLCSAQHKFNARMSSFHLWQASSGELGTYLPSHNQSCEAQRKLKEMKYAVGLPLGGHVYMKC